MKKETLNRDDIVTDAGTQTRVNLKDEIVLEYAEAMESGATFPPLVVFHDGSRYLLADGFHRLFACAQAGIKKVECEVHKGTRTDALKYALGANLTNGLRRLTADKQNCVKIALKEFPNLSDKELARICGVSDHMVADHRPQQRDSRSSETRIGKDGKKRKLPKKSDPEPEKPRVQSANEILSARADESNEPRTPLESSKPNPPPVEKCPFDEPEPEAPKLISCPFCGSEKIMAEGTEKRMAMVCQKCLSRGPEVDASAGRSAAIKLWNQRKS